jgi:hypothetical protein
MGLWQSKVPAFANGGISSGGLSLVGEKVAELVNLTAGSRVYSNSQSKGMLGGEVVFRIQGAELVGVLNNSQRRNNLFIE